MREWQSLAVHVPLTQSGADRNAHECALVDREGKGVRRAEDLGVLEMAHGLNQRTILNRGGFPASARLISLWTRNYPSVTVQVERVEHGYIHSNQPEAHLRIRSG
jgi:hypothetical protein